MVVAVGPAEQVLPASVVVQASGLDRPVVIPPLDQAPRVEGVGVKVVVQLQVMLMLQVLESALAWAPEVDKPVPVDPTVQATPVEVVAALPEVVVAALMAGPAVVEAAHPGLVAVGLIKLNPVVGTS